MAPSWLPWSSSGADVLSPSPSQTTNSPILTPSKTVTAFLPPSTNGIRHDFASEQPQLQEMVATLDSATRTLPPGILAGLAFAIGGTTSLALRAFYVRWLRRVPNADWVTPNMLASQRPRWIRGVVTSVGDADNFRLYHTPGIGWYWPLKFRRIPKGVRALKDKTIHIRIAAIDAPEMGHFGKLAQPGALEAHKWLKDTIHGRSVWVQLRSKDQYQRVVGIPHLPHRILPNWASRGRGRSLALDMLHAGHAVVYEQKGAEYGDIGLEPYRTAEAKAKADRRGIWAAEKVTLPSEYKRGQAIKGLADPADNIEMSDADAEPAPKKDRSGLLRRLFGRS